MPVRKMSRSAGGEPTIGWAAASASPRAKRHPVTWLTTYPDKCLNVWDTTAVAANDGVLYLTNTGGLEVVKGILQNLLAQRGGPLSMTVDEEFQSILKQCQKAIQNEEEDARQIVRYVQGRHGPGADKAATDPKMSGGGDAGV